MKPAAKPMPTEMNVRSPILDSSLLNAVAEFAVKKSSSRERLERGTESIHFKGNYYRFVMRKVMVVEVRNCLAGEDSFSLNFKAIARCSVFQ